jgi:hypothetical protein
MCDFWATQKQFFLYLRDIHSRRVELLYLYTNPEQEFGGLEFSDGGTQTI